MKSIVGNIHGLYKTESARGSGDSRFMRGPFSNPFYLWEPLMSDFTTSLIWETAHDLTDKLSRDTPETGGSRRGLTGPHKGPPDHPFHAFLHIASLIRGGPWVIRTPFSDSIVNSFATSGNLAARQPIKPHAQ